MRRAAAPWHDAFGGLVAGSQDFLAEVKKLIGGKASVGVPIAESLRSRPALSEIWQAVGRAFKLESDAWRRCRRDHLGVKAWPHRR